VKKANTSVRIKRKKYIPQLKKKRASHSKKAERHPQLLDKLPISQNNPTRSVEEQQPCLKITNDTDSA